MTKLLKDVVITSPLSKHTPTIAEAIAKQMYTIPQDLDLSSSVHTFGAVYVAESSVHVGDYVKYLSHCEVCILRPNFCNDYTLCSSYILFNNVVGKTRSAYCLLEVLPAPKTFVL